jgi:hypothetical protein
MSVNERGANVPTPTSLIFSGNRDMISLETIRASNLETRNLENLVAVFGELRRRWLSSWPFAWPIWHILRLTCVRSRLVGGTHGVAESTIKELFLRTTKPRAYIIGR